MLWAFSLSRLSNEEIKFLWHCRIGFIFIYLYFFSLIFYLSALFILCSFAICKQELVCFYTMQLYFRAHGSLWDSWSYSIYIFYGAHTHALVVYLIIFSFAAPVWHTLCRKPFSLFHRTLFLIQEIKPAEAWPISLLLESNPSSVCLFEPWIFSAEGDLFRCYVGLKKKKERK